MEYLVLKEPMPYDGSQLHSLFCYRNFGLMGDSVTVFRGPCSVRQDEMVDQEDVRAQDWIFSEDMLHFIIEHFEMDLEKAIIRQRLLIATIKEELERCGIRSISRDGDDLFEEDRKLSVSISTLSPVSSMIHCGLNVSSRNTPVPAGSLQDLGIQGILEFGESVARRYCDEVKSIRLARCKVKGVI